MAAVMICFGRTSDGIAELSVIHGQLCPSFCAMQYELMIWVIHCIADTMEVKSKELRVENEKASVGVSELCDSWSCLLASWHLPVVLCSSCLFCSLAIEFCYTAFASKFQGQL